MHRQSRFRYACELAVGVLLVMLVLRTWFVLGLIVPMTVAGGSMAPKLLGPHRQAVCGVCGHAFAVGLERLPGDGRAVCSQCGDATIDLRELADRPGERLLVDRTAFEVRMPRRWELVVFRCPDQAGDYCIKRVVGLPGESVQIRRGDVYVDGKIARKNLRKSRAMAGLVYAAGRGASRWRGEDPQSSWQIEETPGSRSFVFPRHDPIDGDPIDGKPIDWLSYHHAGGKPISDDVPYNQGESRALGEVSDLLITCRAKLSGQGELYLSATDSQRRFTISVSPREARLRLLEAGRPLVEVALDRTASAALARGGALLELAVVDRQVLLAVAGQVQLAYAYPRSEAPRRPTSRPLAIGSRGLGVAISDLAVWRDVYYNVPEPRGGGAAEAVFALSADEFFVLGDNSPISADSRTWTKAGLPRKLLIGKPLGAD